MNPTLPLAMHFSTWDVMAVLWLAIGALFIAASPAAWIVGRRVGEVLAGVLLGESGPREDHRGLSPLDLLVVSCQTLVGLLVVSPLFLLEDELHLRLNDWQQATGVLGAAGCVGMLALALRLRRPPAARRHACRRILGRAGVCVLGHALVGLLVGAIVTIVTGDFLAVPAALGAGAALGAVGAVLGTSLVSLAVSPPGLR